MKNSNLKFFAFSFLALFVIQVAGAYTSAPSEGPSKKSTKNATEPMDVSASPNAKYAGLSVNEFISGDTGIILIEPSGNMAINSNATQSDVRLYVEGSVKIKSLAGSGDRPICASTTGSSTDGYPLVICP